MARKRTPSGAGAKPAPGAGAHAPGKAVTSTGSHAAEGIDVVAVRQVVMGDRGRIVLPAAVRDELGLHEGSRLLVTAEADGSLRLRPYRAVADGARGLLAGLGSGSMVDELIAERRAEAAAEDTG